MSSWRVGGSREQAVGAVLGQCIVHLHVQLLAVCGGTASVDVVGKV